jgi:hypothetical protein
VELYAVEVYDLRDLLDGVGVAVTAEAVATWTGAQRERLERYARALGEAKRLGLDVAGVEAVAGPKPPELP